MPIDIDKSTKERYLFQISKYAQYFVAFLGEDITKKNNQYSKIINDYLEQLRYIEQTTLYSFLFNIFQDFEDKTINEDTLCNVLQMLVSYHIRRLLCQVQSNTLKGLYKGLYKRCFGSVQKTNENYFDMIAFTLIKELENSKDVFPTDEFVIKNLPEYKIYSSNKKLTNIY